MSRAKWTAKSCNGGGEVSAVTLDALQSLLAVRPLDHWTIWRDGRYKETWTAFYDVPGVLYCTHLEFGKNLVPMMPSEECEIFPENGA